MDTITLQRQQTEKNATSIASIGIAICLILAQNMGLLANEINNITGISPSINYIKEFYIDAEANFNKNILQKYKNYKVIDVEKGIKHVKMVKYFNGKPVRINVVEISNKVNPELQVEPAIASTNLDTRSKISSIANRENAIVAVNGGYFKPETGTPLGTLMINKKLYTGPIYNRVALGICDDNYMMDRIKLDAKVQTNIGGIKIDNINQPRMLSTHAIIYTQDWGKISPQTPKYGMQLVIENGKLKSVSKNSSNIPSNGYVIIGPEKLLKPFVGANKFNLDIKMEPNWNGVNHIISGGPYLVKNNEIFVDVVDEKLNAIGGRNPRTAIGFTDDNNLIILTADGREGASVGLTLYELANIMKQLGCKNAMNLDGGGSTVMYINGMIVNKPAVQGGIPLSHTLIIRNNYKLSRI